MLIRGDPSLNLSNKLVAAVLFSFLLVQIAGAKTSRDIGSAFITQNADGRLGDFFRCLKKSKVALISAHRAGAYPAYPENALESLQRIAAIGPLMAEVDVMTSMDGVLFLHHDSSLERTTTGKGQVIETSWAELVKFYLRDSEGETTTFTPSRLAEVLAWSRDNIILQLDAKPPTNVLQVAGLVEQIQAMGRVIFIVYSLADAKLLREHYPHAIFSLGVDNDAKLEQIRRTKLDLNNLQALVGAEHLAANYTSLLSTPAILVAGSYGSEQSIDAVSSNLEKAKLKQLLRESMARGIQVLVSNEALNLMEALTEDDTYLEKLRQCAHTD